MSIRKQRRLIVPTVAVIVVLLVWISTRAHGVVTVWAVSGSDAPAASIALVLGDRLDPAGQPGPHLKQRLDRAIGLFEQKRIARIMVSGGGRPAEATAGKGYLIANGIPADRILTESESCSTAENIINSKAILARAGESDPILLITNGFHLKRALTIAEQQGLAAYGLAAETERPPLHTVWPNLVGEVAALSVYPFWVSPFDCP